MVYGFVNRSSGYIKVYSELGIGTTFRVYLPKTEEEKESTESVTSELTHPPGGSELILIVDDEPGLLELAAESLQNLGYRIITAGSGEQAMKCLQNNSDIDLLFSDVVMPGSLNGYQLAEQATAFQPGLKVLLTSGFTSKAVISNGQAKFKVHLLNKPYTQAEMAQRIRNLLSPQDPKAGTDTAVVRGPSE